MVPKRLSTLSLFMTAVHTQNEDTAMTNFFPNITFEDQMLIFEDYQELIKKEEEQQVRFEESCINPQRLREFNRNADKDGCYRQFTIDFGGSSLKITTVEIKYTRGKANPEFATLNQRNYVYAKEDTERIKKMQWYEWVAEMIEDYLKTDTAYSRSDAPIAAALTFSFAMKQQALNSGVVIECNKPFFFSKKDFIGTDVVERLNSELLKRKMHIHVNCVINDVVATYVSGVARGLPNPIALIIGTGTNAGFPIMSRTGEKIVNPEMASFKSRGFKFDKAVEKLMARPENGFHALELSIAGMRFVEIVQEAAQYYTEHYPVEAKLDKSQIDLELIKRCIETAEEGVCASEGQNSSLCNVITWNVLKIKERAYKMLAPILVAASRAEAFTVIANGTLISHKLDQWMLVNSINEFNEERLNRAHSSAEVKVVGDNSATLYGAAFTSLVYSEN